MKNNIYVLLVILVILIILIILFIKTRSLENYAVFSTNINVPNPDMTAVIRSWDKDMFLSACDNECNLDSNCKSFKSTGDINNTKLGNCTLYNSSQVPGKPEYLSGSNVYYKTGSTGYYNISKV